MSNRIIDIECLRGLAEEATFLAALLTRAALTKGIDLDKDLTDASMALAGIYNTIKEASE